jgi:lipopolysaccharide export system permease protein
VLVHSAVQPRLSRYVLREAAGLYVLGLAGLCLLLSIDFLTVLARFLVEQGASATSIARLLVFKAPWFLHLTLPIAVVFAILLAAGRLAKDGELRAAYAGGVSPLRLLVPLVGAGLLVSAVAVVNNGWLEPAGEAAYQAEIQGFLFARPPAATQTDAAFQIPGEGVFFAARLRADRDDPSRAELSGTLVLGADGTTVVAPRGTWNAGERSWTLRDAEVTRPDGSRSVEPSYTVPFPLASTPEETLARPQQQTLTDLSRRIRTLEAVGADASATRFELHRRIADASSAAVFALVAGALGLRVRSRGGGFGWTIALLVLFWAAWTLTGGLFESGVLRPAAAAWVTPALVGAIGLALAWRVEAR